MSEPRRNEPKVPVNLNAASGLRLRVDDNFPIWHSGGKLPVFKLVVSDNSSSTPVQHLTYSTDLAINNATD
jgi:hypothetical protein